MSHIQPLLFRAEKAVVAVEDLTAKVKQNVRIIVQLVL